jgi:hypothetical protein
MTNPTQAWNGELEPLTLHPTALVVGFREGRSVQVGQVSIGTIVADELRGIVDEAATRFAEMPRRQWTAEAAWERDELRVIQRTQLDEDNPVVTALEDVEYREIALDDLRTKSLIFYAIVVGKAPDATTSDQRRVFLRKTNPRLGADRKVVTVLSGDELTRITQPLFTFDRNVDMVYLPNVGILAVNEGPFDMLFRDTPELMEKTPAHARTLAGYLPLAPDSEQVLVEAAVKYSRVRRRVLAAVERGHLVNVTANQLRTELRRQGLTPRDYMQNGRLVISEENVTELMRVLNEDLLTGGLSGQRFEIERKTAL